MHQRQSSDRQTTSNRNETDGSTTGPASSGNVRNVKLRGKDKADSVGSSMPPSSFRLPNRPYSCDVESLSPSRIGSMQSHNQPDHQHHHYFYNNQSGVRQQSTTNVGGSGSGRTRGGRRLNASYQQLTSVIDDEGGEGKLEKEKGQWGQVRRDIRQPPMAVQEDFGLESNEPAPARLFQEKASIVGGRGAVSAVFIQQKRPPCYVNLPPTPVKNYRHQYGGQSADNGNGNAVMQRSASQCDFHRLSSSPRTPIAESASHNRLPKSGADCRYYTNAVSESNVAEMTAFSVSDQMERVSSDYYSACTFHQNRQLSGGELMGSSSSPAGGRDYGGVASIDRSAPPRPPPRTAVTAEAALQRPQASNTSCAPLPPPHSSSLSVSKQQHQHQQKQPSLPLGNPSQSYSSSGTHQPTFTVSVTPAEASLNAAGESSSRYDRTCTKAASQKSCQRQQQTQQQTPRGSLRRGKAVDLTYYSGESQSGRSSSTAGQQASSSQSKEKLQSSTGRKGGNIFRKLIGGSGSCSKSTSTEEATLLSTSCATMSSGGACRAGSSTGLSMGGVMPDGQSSINRPDFSSDSCDFKYEERIRKRIFSHYDCTSICADARPLFTGTSRLKDINLNAATGASQASKPYFFLGPGANGVQPKSPQGETPTSPMSAAGGRDESGSTSGEDRGDGKSNELVLSCPYFRNECGGEPIRQVALCRDAPQQGSNCTPCQNSCQNAGTSGAPRYLSPIDEQSETWHRPAMAAEASVLENLSNVYLGGRLCAQRQPQLVIEHVDQGAFYYRHCFSGKAHQNYFGIVENLGPMAISVVRDKIEMPDLRRLGLTSPYVYRLIIRLSDLTTFRGAILEESLPSYQNVKESREQQLAPAPQPFTPQSPAGTPAANVVMVGTGTSGPGSTHSGTQSGSFSSSTSSGSSSGKIPIKELLELVIPEMQIGCLRLALPVPRTEELLLKLDEQAVYTRYKVGVLYCRAQQSTEEQMYNNETSSPAFDEFLDMLGQRVRLKGFDKYKGGLDSKGDTTGSYSVYTNFEQYEIMFHVSTMLPFTPQNRQQLSRKRHIGNDIVTVIFQEPDALPFSPHTVRSHFQHVFLVVRAHNPNTDNVRYNVAVSRCKDVPRFSPPVPAGANFPKSKDFRDFLLTKIINAENAVHKSEKFAAMSARTRREFMRDLAENHVTSHTLEGSASGKIASKLLGGSKRKDRAKPKLYLDSFCRGAIVWDVQVLVQVEDFSLCQPVECFLGISADNLVLIERSNNEALFSTPTLSIIGWTSHGNSLKLYYDHADVVILRTLEDDDSSEIQEIIKRLQAVTKGCETIEMILRRNAAGQLGFHIQQEGIVSEVEMYGTAWQAGLRQGARIVEICKVSVATLTYERMLELLRSSVSVRVLVVPPLLEDGSPRRGCEDPYCPTVLGNDSPFSNPAGAPFPAGVDTAGSRPKQSTAGRPAPPSYEVAMARRPVASGTTAGGQQPITFTQSMNIEQSPELRSIGATDYGYESGSGGGGNYVSSTKSLDDIQDRPDRRHSSDIRCASADQGGSKLTQLGKDTYSNTARVTAHFPPPDQWQAHHAPPATGPPRGAVGGSGPRTDTLGSTGSTASSEMSSDSTDAVGLGRHRPMRPSELKRRVDKANSDTQQRTNVSTPVLERTVTDPCSSATSVTLTSSTETTPRAPPIPPKTYRSSQVQSTSSGLGSVGALSSVSSSTGHLGVPSALSNPNLADRQTRCSASVQENLIRVINDLEAAGEIEEAIIVSSALYRTLSEPGSEKGEKSDTDPGQRSSDKNAYLSPETDRGIEWSNLVDAATRAIEGMTQRALSNHSSPEFSSYHLRLEAAVQRVKLLEEKVDRLQSDLDKERDAKHALEAEVMQLRDDNKHLEEECKTAKVELKKFTEWFFTAVENSNGQQIGRPPGLAGPPQADGRNAVSAAAPKK